MFGGAGIERPVGVGGRRHQGPCCGRLVRVTGKLCVLATAMVGGLDSTARSPIQAGRGLWLGGTCAMQGIEPSIEVGMQSMWFGARGVRRVTVIMGFSLEHVFGYVFHEF